MSVPGFEPVDAEANEDLTALADERSGSYPALDAEAGSRRMRVHAAVSSMSSSAGLPSGTHV
jgi:hypothetical protein